MLKLRLLFPVIAFMAMKANATTFLPDNEMICLKEMEKLIGKQQMLFSDSQSSQEVRRNAERAIDFTREVFAENNSYCDAQRALQAYENKQESGLRLQEGEVNRFGRSFL
ncbi:hypothetical protein L4D09_22880 [Photobacterium makurazakiensis]|uniref:hypothetical protein n=1 Tax=Photobacterium makurazakiensis TaxID=2910234 RepID=UPI003D0EAF62